MAYGQQHSGSTEYLRNRYRRPSVKPGYRRRSLDGVMSPEQPLINTSLRNKAFTHLLAHDEHAKGAIVAKPKTGNHPGPTNALPEQRTKKIKTGPERNRQLMLLPVMAILIFGLGAFISLSSWRTNQQVEAQVSNLQQGGEDDGNDLPDETPVGDISSYSVAPDLPRFIRINKIDVSARVLRLGVKANNELMAPSSIYDVGWFEGSSKPGDHGAMLMDGHVHGPTRPGVFYNLKKLVPGDKVEVERGDGKIYIYKVVKTKTYDADKVDMVSALISARPGQPGLNLITCAGNVNFADNSYDKRMIVFTVQE